MRSSGQGTEHIKRIQTLVKHGAQTGTRGTCRLRQKSGLDLLITMPDPTEFQFSNLTKVKHYILTIFSTHIISLT